VSGRVQGVFFRGATERRMRELGVRGWVRNIADGRVEALLEAEPGLIEQALEFLRRGPRGAQVAEVETKDESGGDPLGAFEIRS
jgi:acylphosphatase